MTPQSWVGKWKLWVGLFVLLALASACSLFQPSKGIPAPTDTSIPDTSLEPPPALTSTHVPTPIPTITFTDTLTPSPTVEGPGTFRAVASLAGLLPGTTGNLQVRPLADGSVWITTSQEALHWDSQTWEVVLREDEDFLAAVDENGRLWVLRSDWSKIAVWQGGQWTTYDDTKGWTKAIIFEPNWWAPSLWRAYDGVNDTVWLPMAFDVRRFDGNQWRVHTLEDMGFPPPDWEEIEVIHRLAMRDGGKEVWVGECYYSGPGPMGGQGVGWFDGTTWHGVEAPVGTGCVSALEIDLTGNVWLGEIDIVWRYEPASQTWTPYDIPEAFMPGYNFAHTRQLIIDASGDVWVMMLLCGGASCSGPEQLYRIHDSEWSLVLDSQNASTSLKQLALDGSGKGWVFWEGGIYRLEGESTERVASIEARSVGVSPTGEVWVVAGNGEEVTLWMLEP